MADRECNRCVYHSSGSCSAWECEGTKTVKDIKTDTINECIRIVTECVWKDTDMLVELLKGAE